MVSTNGIAGSGAVYGKFIDVSIIGTLGSDAEYGGLNGESSNGI